FDSLSFHSTYPIILLTFTINLSLITYPYTLFLHDALPIYNSPSVSLSNLPTGKGLNILYLCGNKSITVLSKLSSVAERNPFGLRSEEHTSELQSRFDLVCRLLLEDNKYNKHLCMNNIHHPS